MHAHESVLENPTAPVVTSAAGSLVSPAGADEAEQPEAQGWDLVDGLPNWKRDLVAADLEKVEASVEAAGRTPLMM
jgi:hypothetical protein